MGFRPNPAPSSVCALLTEPKLSEIIIHLTFASSSLSRTIHALRKTISHNKLSNARFQQSISNNLKIVPRKHKLHPWKFINVELNFEGAQYIPSIDETLKDILRDFACKLGQFEGCPVSVATSRFLPNSGSHVHGSVNHDELLHYIPRPRIFNGCSTRQVNSTEPSNANSTPLSKADAKIAQFTSIGLRLSGIKLREDRHEPSTSAQESNSDSTSNDGSGERLHVKSAFSELSEELNKQSQQQLQQPLIPQSMGATTKEQPITDDLTMQYHQMRKMQMLANARYSNYQISTHIKTTMQNKPIESTNSSNDSDEGGVSIYIKPTPDCLVMVKEWVEQVETERQDTKEKPSSYPLQNNNSGAITEWPWVQIELHGTLRQSSVAESPALEVYSRPDCEEATSFISESIPSKASSEQLASTGLGSVTSFETLCNAPFAADIKESTSPISECLPHLRGGDASNRYIFKQYFKRITERISHHNFQHDIDLGYGGSNFAAEPFPEYDSTVDLMYVNDFNGIYPIDTRRGIRDNDPNDEPIIKLNPEDATEENWPDSLSAESKSEYHYDYTKNLDISSNSTYSYAGLEINDVPFRGRTRNTAESGSINSPSKSSKVAHKRDKLRAMVNISQKSIRDKFCCEKYKKQPRNGEVENSDEYECGEGISDRFKRVLESTEGKESEEMESSEDQFQEYERYPALVGAGKGSHLRNAYRYSRPESNTHLELTPKIEGMKPSSPVIEEPISEDCVEEYRSRSHVKESETIEIHELVFEENIQEKENRLSVKTSYRLIMHSILKTKLAKVLSQKRRNLARIAQSQLFRRRSPSPIPYGPTKLYVTNRTQLRGGSGTEREARFFKETRLRFARLIRKRSSNEEAAAGPAPTATENEITGSDNGLQTHHRDDSGVSGVGDEQTRDKDESVENETPRQVVNLSEQGAETVETVREVDSDTSEEMGNDAQVEHVEHVEDTESPKPSEPERVPRPRSERQPEENETEHETQRRFRNQLLDILWKFLSLKEEIWFKRNAIIHGAPSSKHNFEAQLTTDEVDDIRQYVQNSCEMIDVSNEPRDAVTFPNVVTRANNHLLRARRVREIFDNWYTREGQQQRQNDSLSDAHEGSSDTSNARPGTASGAGVLDNWPLTAVPSENFRRERNTSETGADIPRTSSDTQLFSRRSSLILAPLPDLFPAPCPGQAFRGETRGESSRSGAGGNEDSSITEKIGVLRAKNNIASRISPYASSVSTIDDDETTQGAGVMPNCREQNEDHVYQEPIPEESMQRLRGLGASRVEAVNLLNATAGNVNRAAEVLQEENPLEQEDMRNLLVDPENDVQQVVVVTGVPPRRAFLALLVSESDVGGAIDLLTGEAIGATMNEEVPIDEVVSEEDSGNGSSGSEMKRDGEGEEDKKSSSEESDGEVAETGEGFETLVDETEGNEGGDGFREGRSEGMNVDAAESDEEYQPLIGRTENNDEDDVHDEEDGIDNDGHANTGDNEDNQEGEVPTIEVEMVLSSRKGKERAEGYDL